MDERKYTVELFDEGSERLERMLASHEDLSLAFILFDMHCVDNPGRLVIPRDCERIIRMRSAMTGDAKPPGSEHPNRR